MDLPDFLTRHEYGEIRLTGHRIGLFHLVYYTHQGDSPEMLLERFPTLSVPLIRQALAYYQDNQAEVDAYVAFCSAEIERQEAAPSSGPSFEELRRRFEALQGGKAP
jgi:uncharacterized protein (DUF433 family)